MKNIIRKIIAAVLSVSLVLSLAGCDVITGNKAASSAQQDGSKAASSQDTASSGQTSAFSETTLDALNNYAEVGEGGIFYEMAVYDDRIYLVYARNGRRLGTSSGNLIYYSSWDLEGNRLSDVLILDTGENIALDVMSDTGESIASDAMSDTGENLASEVMALDVSENNASDSQDEELRGYVGECLISSEGILYYFETVNRYDVSGKSAEYECTYFKAIDTDGAELFCVNISDWPGEEEGEYQYFYFLNCGQERESLGSGQKDGSLGSEAEDASVNSKQADESGNDGQENASMASEAENVLTVWDGETIYRLDLQGNLLSYAEADEVFWGQQEPLFSCDGLPVFQIYDSGSGSYSYLMMDVTTGESAGEAEVMEDFTEFSVYSESSTGYIFTGGDSGYDLILADSYGVYGYDFGDSEQTAILEYQDSGLSVRKINQVVFLSGEQAVICYVGYDDYDHFSVLKRESALEETPEGTQKQAQEKQELTLAVYGADYENIDIDRMVSEFNENSDFYRIVVVDYSEYATSDDENAGVTRLNNEILAGEGPDIFFNDIAGSFDFDSYAEQGILADFYELMEEDPEFEKSDYLENVFEAFEKDGSLYELVPEFQLYTCLGKRSIFGDEPLTWERLAEIMEAYPSAAIFGTEYSGQNSRESLLYLAFRFCYEDFIDEEAGTCDFTSGNFRTLLEFIVQSTQGEGEGGDSRQYIEDRALLYLTTIDTVPFLYYYYYPVFGEDFVAAGFPGESGVSALIISSGSFAISSSGNVEGAWEFVKMFLSEEEQMPDEDLLFSYGIPVLKAAVKEVTDRMTQLDYHTVDGEKVYSAYETSVGGVVMEIEPAAQEQADRWYEYLCGVNRKLSWNYEDVMSIVLEETGAYFAGQKSAEEVAQIIQSRVSIMLSEDE